MIRRPRIALVAVALLAPLALAPSTASAVDQDLVVSATGGAPGSVIEVSSASCTSEVSFDDELFGGTLRYLQVRLLSGEPERVLAGLGVSSFDESGAGGPARLVVPDWLDPDAPAAIEATCFELTLDGTDVAEAETAYDPVPFDVEPGAGPSVQAVTFSRTALRTGQGLTADVAGCTLDGATGAEVALARGADRSGSNLRDVVTSGETGGGPRPAPVELLLNDASVSFGYSIEGDEVEEVELEENPSTIDPGSYTAYSLCFAEDDDETSLTVLVFEPEAIEVTGTSPTTDLDLVVEPGTRSYELGGGSCDRPTVRSVVDAQSIGDRATASTAGDAADRAQRLLASRRYVPGLAAETGPRPGGTEPGDRGGTRMTRSFLDDLLVDEVPVDADGTWSIGDDATFDRGILWALAACGDPFGDGFAYDPQAAVIEVPGAEPPAPPAPPGAPAPLPAPPAAAVTGSPRYAG